jgi:hypothetical protein
LPPAGLWIAPLFLATTVQAFAQNVESETDRRVQDMVTAQKNQTDLRDKRCYLPYQPADEIIVCRKIDTEADRYPGRDTLESVNSTKDGLPRAPDFAKPSCKGQVGCVSIGSVPPPVYYIDVKEIPESPANSDADLIAKGEKAEP